MHHVPSYIMYNRHNSKEDTANPKLLHKLEASTLLGMVKKAQKELLIEVKLMETVGGGNPVLEYVPLRNHINLVADVDGFAITQLFSENEGGLCLYHRARFPLNAKATHIVEALNYYTSEAYASTEYQTTGKPY